MTDAMSQAVRDGDFRGSDEEKGCPICSKPKTSGLEEIPTEKLEFEIRRRRKKVLKEQITKMREELDRLKREDEIGMISKESAEILGLI